MRLQEYSRKNTISNEISEAYGNRAEEIQNGAEIEANDRGNFVVLLKDEYQDIERSIQPLDFSETIVPIKEGQEEYRKLLGRLKDKLTAVVASADAIDFKSAEIDTRIARFKELNESYFNEFDNHLEKLASWDQAKECFQFGRHLAHLSAARIGSRLATSKIGMGCSLSYQARF